MIFKRIRGLLTVQDEFQSDSLTEFAIGDVVEVVVDRRRGAQTHVGKIVNLWDSHFDLDCSPDLRYVPCYHNEVLSIKFYDRG